MNVFEVVWIRTLTYSQIVLIFNIFQMANQEVLLRAHECDADKEIALQEISNIHQEKSSISEYVEKIRKLCTSRDRLMATQFLNGVSKEIRTELSRLPTAPKTLKEMVTQAEKIDDPRPRRLAQRRG